MEQFTKDEWYANLNGLGDHRYHRSGYRADPMPSPGPPKDINQYIEYYKTDCMNKGEQYAVMDESVIGLKKECRKRSLKALWVHRERDVQMILAIQPAGTRWMQYVGDEEYQGATKPPRATSA